MHYFIYTMFHTFSDLTLNSKIGISIRVIQSDTYTVKPHTRFLVTCVDSRDYKVLTCGWQILCLKDPVFFVFFCGTESPYMMWMDIQHGAWAGVTDAVAAKSTIVWLGVACRILAYGLCVPRVDAGLYSLQQLIWIRNTTVFFFQNFWGQWY